MKSAGYSNGEFPYSNPSAIFPSLSPAVIPSICLPSSIQRRTLSTGITHLAPLCNAVAIVEVALNTSMITMMLLLISYKCTRAGESEVCNDGLLSIPANVMERELPFEQRFPFIALCIFLDRLVPVPDQFFHVPREVKSIQPFTDRTIWTFKMKHVDHDRSIFTGLKKMFMLHFFKRTLRLFVNKPQWLLHFGNFYTQYSCFKEMFSFPGNGLIFFDQAKPRTCNCFFPMLLH